MFTSAQRLDQIAHYQQTLGNDQPVLSEAADTAKKKNRFAPVDAILDDLMKNDRLQAA